MPHVFLLTPSHRRDHPLWEVLFHRQNMARKFVLSDTDSSDDDTYRTVSPDRYTKLQLEVALHNR